MERLFAGLLKQMKLPKILLAGAMVSGSGILFTAPFRFVFLIKGLPHIRRAIKDGEEIISRVNIRQLKKSCEKSE